MKEFKDLEVAFYTVKLGKNPSTEYTDFVNRMNTNASDSLDLSELRFYIKDTIGLNPTGADLRFFKKEGSADRIKQPTPETYVESAPDPKDYGLRLFCYRASDRIVILFNGDRKTRLEVRDCKKCSPYFDSACSIADAITMAVHADKKIVFTGTDIEYLDPNFNLQF